MLLNTVLLTGSLFVFNDCNGQNLSSAEPGSEQRVSVSIGDTVQNPGKYIDDIFQDKDDNYWFASNGEGVFRYDGKVLLHITAKHGLCSDYVWKVQEDINGMLWFVTRDGFCCFDGEKFTDYTEAITKAPYGKLVYTEGGLFFNHLNGICFYDGKSFMNFNIHPPAYIPPSNTTYRPYTVYCTMADRSGKVWFGTQEKGVCLYNGDTFTFMDSLDLGGPAVRSIFQDRNGILWFGNNGGGFYRYDGKTLRNLTEEKNLTNYEFLRERKPVSKQGSLARVFAINEDNEGNIWIGTVDAGVWKYNGADLTRFTLGDGLSGNAVYVIFKDRYGKLWFVSNGELVYHFDGQQFSAFGF